MFTNLRKKQVLIVVVYLFFGYQCLAATYYVRFSGGDYTNIQAALNNAVENDTIIVGDGTYSGSGNYNLQFNADNVLRIIKTNLC